MQRKATTLIEIVICMSIGSSLMLLAIGLTHQAMTVSSRARERADFDRTALRLAQQLRHDAHRATDVTLQGDNVLQVEFPDKTIATYKVVSDGIARDHVLQADTVEHEFYSIGEECVSVFKVPDGPKRVELLVNRRSELKDVAPRMELHVVSTVGKLVIDPRQEEPDND